MSQMDVRGMNYSHPPLKIWDVCGRAQLAAGVFLSAETCIYGRPDPALCVRGETTAKHSSA